MKEEFVLKPRVWWVNQGVTYIFSRDKSILWAPITDRRGRELGTWSEMAYVRTGDLVIHCSRGKIRALGKATSDVYKASRPLEFAVLEYALPTGRMVDIEYYELNPPILVADVASKILDLGIKKGPLNKLGMPKQSYLLRFSVEGLRILREATDTKWPDWADKFLV